MNDPAAANVRGTQPPQPNGRTATHTRLLRTLALLLPAVCLGLTACGAQVVSTFVVVLRWVASTEAGTAEAKETHKRFTIAFYCSAVFKRIDA